MICGSFWSSYVFVSAINEFSMLKNPYLGTKIASLAYLEAEILKISENPGFRAIGPGGPTKTGESPELQLEHFFYE